MTFGTTYGRYYYLRVPMGASLSSDVYQFKIDEIFEDIPQCVGIADNIIICSYNHQDHDSTLYSVPNRACKVGMKFNPDKCIFKQDNISFYGVMLSADGVKPDPRKIDAIKKSSRIKDRGIVTVILRHSQLFVQVQPKYCKDDM